MSALAKRNRNRHLLKTGSLSVAAPVYIFLAFYGGAGIAVGNPTYLWVNGMATLVCIAHVLWTDAD